MNQHGPFSCTFSEMDVISEEIQGLRSGIKFKCRMCNTVKVLWTGQPGGERNINAEAVIAIMSIGGGYSNMEEMFSCMNIPTMSQSTYNKEHTKVCEAFEQTALRSMEDAAAEEKRLAIERGDVDVEGVPYFAVVVDGSWAKRSYRNNYSSLSGMKAAAAAVATENLETSLDPEIVIKEEPIDVDETDVNQPSTSRTEFILSTSDTLTPSLGVAYSVADLKKENSTSPLSNGDKQATTSNVKRTSARNKKRRVESDVAVETVSTLDSAPESNSVSDRPKDQFDAYGEYIAAKLRKLDWKSCAYVQKAIGDIMFEAEMGKYKEKSP